MDKKYYTPTIDEFHVGFEVEHSIFGRWVQAEITDQDTFNWIRNEIAQSHIRVKCLDKEDIEALGWKEHIEDRNLFGSKSDLWLALYPDQSIRIWDDTKDIEHFNGTIRNKSELKTLMRFLNIKPVTADSFITNWISHQGLDLLKDKPQEP